MSLLPQRKRLADKSEHDRQKAILYKNLFSTDDGREVLKDLMNRYFFLQYTFPNHTASEAALLEKGRRQVVEDIMVRASVDMVQFDKLLKGEI